MTSLRTLSNELADLVATASAHLVTVRGRRRQAATGIVWSSGVVVTADHVLRRDEGILVTLPSGEKVAAELAGRDGTTDVAVLRVTTDPATAPEWAPADGIRVGELVAAVGLPSADVRVSIGAVTAVRGPWRTGAGGLVDAYIQPDIVMYPGFSGGPLVATDGRFVGMNSSALLRGAHAALPHATLLRVVPALLQHGRVPQGYLGVSIQPVPLPGSLAEELGQDLGVLLVAVEADSPAAAAGLHLGDVLVGLDDVVLRELDDLLAALAGDRIGREVPVRYVRGGEARTTAVRIGEAPATAR
jgi:S1-C subfamily serine protease